MSTDWGLTEKTFSNGAGYADLDNDGDLDLVINNIDELALVYENTAENLSNNFIAFELLGDKGITLAHASIEISCDGEFQYLNSKFVRGFMSAIEPRLNFGIGKNKTVDFAKVKWPDGTVTTIANPEINKTHKVYYQNASKLQEADEVMQPKLNDISHMQSGVSYRHQENLYNDFKKEILLPHKQSTLGPFLSVGDANGDGLVDFFVGGAKGQAGVLYYQGTSGLFYDSQMACFVDDKKYEDTGSLFVDLDNDNDMDLVVVSGGGADMLGAESNFVDRLYYNDGTGKYQRKLELAGSQTTSGSKVLAHDWDSDGDLDLTILGRTSPGAYPKACKTSFYQNNNNQFEEVGNKLNPIFENIGMMTDGKWVNLDGDEEAELVLVGEWSGIRIFDLQDGILNEVSSKYGTDEIKGWWYSIASADIDNDGDQDLIVGNIGLNSKFKSSREKPLKLYYNDFDENGTGDIVLSNEYKGNYVPVRGRQCSSEQMPFIEEKFPDFAQFATAGMTDIYGEEKLEASYVLEANEFRSILLENNGSTFEVRHLPIEAQTFPVNSIVATDLNKDGYTDLLLAGNMFNTEPETPSYDGGNGLVLLSKEGKSFESILPKDSGALLGGNVKDIAPIKIDQNKVECFLVANNNSKLQFIVNMFNFKQQN